LQEPAHAPPGWSFVAWAPMIGILALSGGTRCWQPSADSADASAVPAKAH